MRNQPRHERLATIQVLPAVVAGVRRTALTPVPSSAGSLKWALRAARGELCCKARSTAMPVGIATSRNAAARPHRVASTDPISMVQWHRIGTDGPPRMEARPTGSGRERSSPNRCDQCRGQARHLDRSKPSIGAASKAGAGFRPLPVAVSCVTLPTEYEQARHHGETARPPRTWRRFPTPRGDSPRPTNELRRPNEGHPFVEDRGSPRGIHRGGKAPCRTSSAIQGQAPGTQSTTDRDSQSGPRENPRRTDTRFHPAQ